MNDARIRQIAADIYVEVADEPLGDLTQRRQKVQDQWHDAVRAALSRTAPSIDDVAATLAAADGLDWSEVCAHESGADECDSSTCVAAYFEEHDPESARRQYRRYARHAMLAIGVTPAMPEETQPSLFDGDA